MIPLPIDPLLSEIVARLRTSACLVLEAPPGAGKTTRVPRAMLDAGMARSGEIVVLQPRRLAARMTARRVAEELGSKVGDTVGYQVRFEDLTSAQTRVRFVTEGILTRRLLSDPTLKGVCAVVLDEFHERHLQSDVALALLRKLQRGPRPDLRLVVMSATLEAEPVVRYLDSGPAVRAEGTRFDVAVEYLSRPDERSLALQVASAVQRLVADGLDGDVLVFLPGAAEIRRARETCETIASRANLLVLPLHGDLSPAEQDRAVRPGDRRKVVLATNVAETSVTIDGVVAVVDSGLARIAAYAPWSGLPTLRVGRISRASAIQRAGRAGRTRAGRCLRLYTRHDYDTRPEYEAPEIARLDLAETVLELKASGVSDPHAFEWFEAPPARALAAAEGLLVRLGALEPGGAVTALGRSMLRFALHPRQARIILEAERLGIAEPGCTLAALLGEREIRTHGGARGSASARSDLLETLELFEEAAWRGFDPREVRALGLEPAVVLSVDRVRRQLARATRRGSSEVSSGSNERETALLKAILVGYPDRVGRRRRAANATGRVGDEVVFATGGTAVLADTSVVRDAELLVAVDAEERTEGARSRTLVRVASAIEPDWLLELLTDAVRDVTEVTWNATAERAESVRRLWYDGLLLEESPDSHPDPNALARVLCEAALSKGITAFVDGEAFDRFVSRLEFLREQRKDLALAALDAVGTEAMVREACVGKKSFAQLRSADLLESFKSALSPAQARQLAELAPEKIDLPGGRRVRVEYPPGGSPWIASRLQDFFGMTQGPAIVGGRVPLVLHLLAPNQRAVQVTTDLSGFWAKHYPAIAKELRRKYPRHSWPDDPKTAVPPTPHPRR